MNHLRRLYVSTKAAGQDDGQLLERFVQRRDEEAFAALVRRHGPLVWGVCRRLLPRIADAEDAFQATFLVLIRRARTLERQQGIGGWLYGVAYRTAKKARAIANRRIDRERSEGTFASGTEFVPDLAADASWRELRSVLDEELNRLPERYRLPIVLCYFEGKSKAAAAQELGWPPGTVSGRLARARSRLRDRLLRRGVTLSAVALATALEQARAGLPAALSAATQQLATNMAAGAVPAAITHLTREVLKTMTLNRLRYLIMTAVAAVAFGLCVLLIGYHAFAADPPPVQAPPKSPPRESAVKEKTDHERIQGTWVVVSLTREGTEMPVEKDKEIRYIFAGDRLFMKQGERLDRDIHRYQLNPTQNPKTLDLSKAGRDAGDEKTYYGLYEMQEDKLRICLGNREAERPTELVSKPGSKTSLIILKRSAVAEKIDEQKALSQEQINLYRRRSAKNLAKISIAMILTYHDRHGHLPPPAICDTKGKPLLSWRVALLPYLGHDELYRQFRLSEPWDSEHNKKLLPQMPAVYGPVGVETKQEPVTYYRVFTGLGTAFEGKEGVKLEDFSDGRDTILLIEAGEPVPWTKPEELDYNPNNPLPRLGGLFDGGFHILMASGAGVFVQPKFKEEILRDGITRNDGRQMDFLNINK